jgi:hypothetical protein
VVKLVGGRLLERPTEVRHAERCRPADRGDIEVVHEHDPARLDEPAEIDQVEKDRVEAVVAVDEREALRRARGGDVEQAFTKLGGVRAEVVEPRQRGEAVEAEDPLEERRRLVANGAAGA